MNNDNRIEGAQKWPGTDENYQDQKRTKIEDNATKAL